MYSAAAMLGAADSAAGHGEFAAGLHESCYFIWIFTSSGRTRRICCCIGHWPMLEFAAISFGLHEFGLHEFAVVSFGSSLHLAHVDPAAALCWNIENLF
ncbi:hypothetical protein U1Q18_037278 [Sarracenia purpurea var. burkii]